jgi:UDP-N-acetyl-D-mannosaminuronic acid dehydrogenase
MHAGRVLAVEPNVDTLPPELNRVRLVSFDDALSEADIHLMLVDHKEFKITKKIPGLVIDTKGIW